MDFKPGKPSASGEEEQYSSRSLFKAWARVCARSGGRKSSQGFAELDNRQSGSGAKGLEKAEPHERHVDLMPFHELEFLFPVPVLSKKGEWISRNRHQIVNQPEGQQGVPTLARHPKSRVALRICHLRLYGSRYVARHFARAALQHTVGGIRVYARRRWAMGEPC